MNQDMHPFTATSEFKLTPLQTRGVYAGSGGGGFAGKHLSGSGQRGQPGGRVYRIPQHRELDKPGSALDNTGERDSGVDTHPDRQPGTIRIGMTGGLQQISPSLNRHTGMVLPCERRKIIANDLIAGQTAKHSS